MRNLKKILALVLALVMSLSLMATAGATDFKDDDQFTETYKTAAEVLEKLGVLRGDPDGSFRPTGSITRAEAAAAVYRIVTGDVDDKQVGIYADYNIFRDVQPTDWYAGYVNFCANAEYIKGNADGSADGSVKPSFGPNDQVNGYAVLAMILRAIGYTANGGFTGDDWAVQTARTAEARTITKNVLTGTLGQPAARETVAELLYEAIMVNMVDHDQDNTFNGNQGYFEKTTTLGQQIFGLEKVSGVILANEWANLEDNAVLGEGKTRMVITDITTVEDSRNVPTIEVGKKLTLDAVAENDMQGALDAVGLTYDAHIATKRGNLVASLEKSDVNNVAYNEGKGVYTANKDNNNLNNATWASVAKLAEKEGIALGSTVVGADHETEYFVNYEQWWEEDYRSDIIIRYTLDSEALKLAVDLGYITLATAQAYIDYLNDLANITTPNKYSPQTVTVTGNPLVDGKATTPVLGDKSVWIRTIQPGKLITKTDRAIMEDIFDTASRLVDGTKVFELGEVYAGTSQTDDKSDDMSWAAFQKEYFIVDENSLLFTTCAIGNSLRVIDNNGDGYAEYVLRIDYTQDKIVGTLKNAPVCNSVAFSSYDEAHLYNPENVADNGTVVNYVDIDKKLYVWPAAVVTDSITNKNFQKITVTTASGDEYNQSGIRNMTKLDENIMLMNQNTPYNMYMDVYGNNIRSYELAQGGKYALLTEMYPTTDRNSNYVQDIGAIAEVKIQDADVKEYPVVLNTTVNAAGDTTLNPFFSRYIWTWGARAHSGADAWGGVIPTSWLYNANYLQPAVAHLNIPPVTGGNPSHVISPAVNTGRTDNDVDGNYAPNQNANGAWWRYTAEALPYANWANGNGSQIGVFDYDFANATYTTVDEQQVLTDANAAFSFTNVATYVDNNGTLTLGSASKLATSRVNGAQLYRVSTAAAAAVPTFVATATAENKAMVSLWGHGTEAELVAAYNQATGTDGGQAWFNAYTSATYNDVNYQNGTGIYPIYETDYVQLDLTKGDKGEVLAGTDLVVKPGIRHFHIDDNYSQYYNTNSNEYVDATINTEFYIVLPGTTANTIMYKVGYADLPNIEVNKIRAAYAVAKNTSNDSNSRDYWIADVIVIEVSELTYDYDSISLVYYNPFVQDGYTRYGNTLNNEWRNLQPDYDGKAMMGITPKRGFNDIDWGDASWSIGSESNYKFWRLYQTELTAPGQLAVTKATAIDKDYNTYGIYAGEATRIEGLQTSEYMDVSTKNTGIVQTYAVDINYNEAAEVPFYTITGSAAAYGRIYTAKQINLTNTLRYSDVKNGDRLIWVYDKAQGRVAFVVDLDSRADGYVTPGWLSDLYDDIIADQGNSGSGIFDINGLIDRAEKVDNDANATQKDWDAMIKELNEALANPNVTMNNAQRTRFDTVMDNLKAKAYPGNKTAALLAAQEMANAILLNSNATSAIKSAVSGKLTTLTGAINSAGNYTALEAIYKNGKLVANQTDVKNLSDAVALANAQIAAIAVATKAVTDAGLAVTDGSVSSQYNALVSAIEGCNAITHTTLTSTDVEFYVKNGKLVEDATDTTVSDLLDAIDAAAIGAALTKAQTDAKAAADKLAAGCEALVGTQLGNLKTAIDNYVTSVTGGTDAQKKAATEVLNAAAAGNWDATIANSGVWNAYNALIQAVAANKDQAAADAAVDAAVVPEQIGDNAEVPTGGIDYPIAYQQAGVTVTPNANGATITIDSAKFNPFMQNKDGLYTQAMKTMRPHDAGGPIVANPFLAAGVSFKAPAGATQVKIYITDGAALTPAQIATLGAGLSWDDTVTQGPGTDFRPDGVVNIWSAIATGTDDSSVGGCELKDISYRGNRTRQVYMQFTDGTNNIGGVIHRVIDISMS